MNIEEATAFQGLLKYLKNVDRIGFWIFMIGLFGVVTFYSLESFASDFIVSIAIPISVMITMFGFGWFACTGGVIGKMERIVSGEVKNLERGVDD